MHEFSLAQNIIEIVDESLKANNAFTVDELVLEVGTLAGVEIPALEMALESLKPSSKIENAKIKIEILQARAICMNCSAEHKPVEFFASCPTCGSFDNSITEGKELRVKSILAE